MLQDVIHIKIQVFCNVRPRKIR